MNDKNKTIDIIELVKNSPQEAAMISKLVSTRNVQGRHVGDGINIASVSSMAMENARRQNDVRIALGLFPDIKLAAQTLISLLLSPTDGVQTEFRYEMKTDVGLPAPAIAEIMEIAKTYLEVDCDLRNRVHDIAQKAVIENGANPTLVLPESSLEHFLNNPGTLSLTGESDGERRSFMVGLNEEISKIIDIKTGVPKPMHLFHNAIGANESILLKAMESAYGNNNANTYDPYIKFAGESASVNTAKKESEVKLKLLLTDNVGVLRLPQVTEHIREKQTNRLVEASRLGYTRFDDKEKSKEYAINLNDDQIQSNFYRRPGAPTATPFGVIKDPRSIKRRTIGKPLIIDLPPESLLVIPKPSNSREHVYYLAMVDMDGNFVRIDNYEDGFNSLARNFAGHTDNPDTLNSSFMQLANSRFNGDQRSNNADEYERKEMIKNIYQQLVDSDIKARLRVGFGSSDIKINTANEHIYEIMLAREISNRNTQLLLIPASLVSYFAFTYDENGIGRSLLDESRNILSIRSMMMVAEVFNSVRNAISRTMVDVSIDSRDRDPMGTQETVKNRILSGRDGLLPWGSFDLGSIAKQLQRAGIEITYSGDNKLMPNTSIKYSEGQTQHQMMDDTFRDELRKLSLAGFSMTPELIDGNKQEELATAVKENRAQLGRRIAVMSTEFNGTLKGFTKNLIKYNGTIYDRINLIIIKNIKFIAKEVYKSKSLPSDVLNLLKRDEKTQKLNKKNIWMFVKYITELVIDSIECTLPTYQRNSFNDRIKELEDKTSALDFLLDNTFNEDSLKTAMGDNTDSISTAKAAIKASVIREWFAEAGIDDVIGKYIEKPNIALTNTATKEITNYNQRIISLLMGMVKGDKEVAEIVKTIMDKMEIGEDSDSSSSDSSSDDDSDDGGDSGDGDDGDSGDDGDDSGFGDLDDMFGGTSLDDDGGDDKGSDDSESDDGGADEKEEKEEEKDDGGDEE